MSDSPKPHDLEERTFLFAQSIRAFVKSLPRTVGNPEDGRQLVRASGSVAANCERARKFYQETLELKPATTAMGGAWVEYELGATTIGVGCHPAWQPSREGTTVAFEVEDIDAAIGKLKERGVAFDMEKTETPVCWMAQFRDPDGNKLLVHKRKGSA